MPGGSGTRPDDAIAPGWPDRPAHLAFVERDGQQRLPQEPAEVHFFFPFGVATGTGVGGMTFVYALKTISAWATPASLIVIVVSDGMSDGCASAERVEEAP